MGGNHIGTLSPVVSPEVFEIPTAIRLSLLHQLGDIWAACPTNTKNHPAEDLLGYSLVNCGQRVVKNEQLRSAIYCAGDVNALTLPS